MAQPWWSYMSNWPAWAKNYQLQQMGQATEQATGQTPNLYGRAWFPGLYGQIFEQLGTEEATKFKQLQDLMSQNVGQLGQTLGAEMARRNVPIAGGSNMVARRFLAPMQTQMQNWMQTQRMPWSQKVGLTLQMANQFAPLFEAHVGADKYWEQIMNKFMKELFGGGGK